MKMVDANRAIRKADINEVGRDVVYQAQAALRVRPDQSPQSKAGLIVTDEDRELVSRLLMETYEAYKMPPVKSDEELMQRLDQYFQRCTDRGIVPTVEEMVLYCGYTNEWMRTLESGRNKGFTSQTASIIKKAKHFLHGFDTKLAESGKLNFLVYCFRSKNYYGMTDRAELTIAPAAISSDEYSVADIRKRYGITDDFEDPDIIEID